MHSKTAYAATTGPRGSWIQLFNPLSQLMGGNDRYPAFTGWMPAKVAAVSLLAAAVAGGIRGVRHLEALRSMEDMDDPARKMRAQLGTTFMPDMEPDVGRAGQEKTASESEYQNVPTPGPLEIGKNLAYTGIPLAAALLAAAGSWRLADDLANQHRNDILSSAVAKKSEAMKVLLRTRARVAKGSATPEEVQDALNMAEREENFIKVGNFGIMDLLDRIGVWKKAPEEDGRGDFFTAKLLLTSAGLVGISLMAATAIGSYQLSKKNDPAYIKYKAYKEGLEAYARTKASHSPITTIPVNAGGYFNSIDGVRGDAKPASRAQVPAGMEGLRAAPELQGGGQPVTVTL